MIVDIELCDNYDVVVCCCGVVCDVELFVLFVFVCWLCDDNVVVVVVVTFFCWCVVCWCVLVL